jgi:hypothetical protein
MADWLLSQPGFVRAAMVDEEIKRGEGGDTDDDGADGGTFG